MSKATAKKKYQEKNAVYAEWYGCDVRTITRYKQRGYPLDNREDMRDILAAQKNSPSQSEESDPSADSEIPIDKVSQAEAKRRMTIAQFRKIDFQLAVEMGKYELNETVIESGYSIGASVGAAIDKLSADLPALLLGLDESAMSKTIRREGDKIKAALADKLSKLSKKKR